jgi:hypothetical protein
VHRIKRRTLCHQVIKDSEEDVEHVHMHFRISKGQFNYLHNLSEDDAENNSTRFRVATASKCNLECVYCKRQICI